MSHYKSNMRDIEFNLFDVLGVDEYLGEAPFSSMDLETVKMILQENERLATNEFADSFVEADRVKLELKDGEIELPPKLKKAIDAYWDSGFGRIAMGEELGGGDAPPTVAWATIELVTGGNATAYLYASGELMARVLWEEGNDEQKKLARLMLDRNWGGTMILTEPDAGSDVGAGLSKAHQIEGDTYHIEGVKRFITSGEWDHTENIIHLVLARPEGAGPGTKGLSMFAVPKYMINEDGSLGARNGVFCTNIEDKMGIRGSTTCEMTFGADEPAIGYLVGSSHEGIRQMFRVIEHARMMIGIKSASTLSTGYLNALEYAKERKQGPDLANALDKAAPRVPIIQHPDVRRMLMLQKAYAEGLRALYLYTGWVQDQSLREPDNEYWHRLNDLLLPMVKGYSSEKAYELLAQSLQVFGGSGFTKDYPIEQYIRDAKIDTLYEGTTGIQAMDLFFRKIAKDQGQTLTRLAGEITELVKGGGTFDPMSRERALLGTALQESQAQLGVMVRHLMASQAESQEIYKVGFHTNSLLETLSEIMIAYLLIRQAEVASQKMQTAQGEELAWLEGKVEAVRFFCQDALPKARLRRETAELEGGELMELPLEAF